MTYGEPISFLEALAVDLLGVVLALVSLAWGDRRRR